MRKRALSFWRWMVKDRWEVRQCDWPFPEGYCVYNPYRKSTLGHGCSKEGAEGLSRSLNVELRNGNSK